MAPKMESKMGCGKIIEIQNTRRVLAVALTQHSDQLSQVIRSLTGSYPDGGAAFSSLAGATSTLPIRTAYYSADVPVWLDLIVGPPADWADAFLSPEAAEVLAALGGLVVVFATPAATATAAAAAAAITTTAAAAEPAAAAQDLVREMGRVVRDGLGGWSWDGITLAVGVGPIASADELDGWDSCCTEAGLEFVHVAGGGPAPVEKNEFGEKTGIPRLLEALEANDWARHDDAGLGSDHDDGSFGEFETAEPGSESPDLDLGLTGDDERALRAAILAEDQAGAPPREGADAKVDDDDVGDVAAVEKVESMLRRLQVAREAGEGMSPDQRRRAAAQAVAQVMREL